jgi:type II secretion system protein J
MKLLLAARVARRAGFTLVEVLVTILIISGIMMAVTELLNATRITRDTIHNVQETQMAGPAILDLIERDLRGLFTYDLKADGILRVDNRVLIGRDADSLDFIATTDNLTPWEIRQRYVRCDINEVGYRLRPNPADKDLLEIYRRESFGVDDDPFEGGQYTFLHDRVKHFDIQVFTEDGPDAEPEEEWDPGIPDQRGLPRRIQIELVLELAPRILREQLAVAPVEKRTVTYRRVLRLPESLRASLKAPPMPAIPVITAPTPTDDESTSGKPKTGNGNGTGNHKQGSTGQTTGSGANTTQK